MSRNVGTGYSRTSVRPWWTTDPALWACASVPRAPRRKIFSVVPEGSPISIHSLPILTWRCTVSPAGTNFASHTSIARPSAERSFASTPTRAFRPSSSTTTVTRIFRGNTSSVGSSIDKGSSGFRVFENQKPSGPSLFVRMPRVESHVGSGPPSRMRV